MTEVIVLGFERESQADEVFLALSKMGSKQRLIDLEDSTVVFRDREGKVQFGRIKQDRSQPEDHLGAALATGGSLIGLLVGALMQHPLLGTAIGMVIGAILGLLAEANEPLRFDAPLIRELGRLLLAPETSALLVLVRKAQPERVLEQLSQFEGKVLLASFLKEKVKLS